MKAPKNPLAYFVVFQKKRRGFETKKNKLFILKKVILSVEGGSSLEYQQIKLHVRNHIRQKFFMHLKNIREKVVGK